LPWQHLDYNDLITALFQLKKMICKILLLINNNKTDDLLAHKIKLFSYSKYI